MSSSGVAGTTAANVWAAVTRTLTNPSGVWSDVTRVLTAFAFRSLLNMGLPASRGAPSAQQTGPASSVTIDAFGAWVQVTANVGTGVWLAGVTIRTPGENGTHVEIEIGEGAAAAEAAVGRFSLTDSATSTLWYPLWLQLTNNARLSARARSSSGAAQNYYAHPLIV